MNKFFFILFAFLFTSCASVQNLEYKGFDGFKLKDVTTEPKVNMNIHLHNPNPIGATLKRMDFALIVNNASLGNIVLEEKVRMKKHSDFYLPIAMQTSLTQLGSLAKPGLDALFSDNEIPFNLSGELMLTKFWIFRKTFQFEYSDEINLKEIQMY